MKNIEDEIRIYIHIPFCVNKCLYCDFNSIAVSPIPEENYVQALIKEINTYAKSKRSKLKEDAFVQSVEGQVTSIYFGGGTPSLFSADNIARIIKKVISNFTPAPDIEITLEINPKTADMKKLRNLKTKGVNRLSIGVQSFQDKFLKRLGRIHSSSDAVNLFEDARASDFSNINLDLIFGIPGQTLDDWECDLDYALSIKPEHISVYNLTIEENTPLYILFQLDLDKY